MDAFLERSGWKGAQRRMLAGDASFRRYERVDFNGTIAVLMDAPPPWEDVRPFLHITKQLAACSASVPGVIAADEDEGFLLLEDFGDASFSRVLREHPSREQELYHAATDALIAILRASDAEADAFREALPPYDMAVYQREVALFTDWFLPQVVGMEKAKALRDEWLELWRSVIEATGLKQSCLVHRDYHADNLFWLSDRTGHHAVGMLDYQDALWGDPAYDLASLLEDARRDVSAETVAHCLDHFIQETGAAREGFLTRYAVLAAQRNAKIIGIFTRLCVRDGKAHYLDFLPRVWGHFIKDLEHPALLPIKAFVDQHVPAAWRGSFKANASIGGIAA
jgi:aminoglycoside/choline kinase family phosphotransferase